MIYAQRIGSLAADYSKTTDSENHFFYQMATVDRRRRRSVGAGVRRLKTIREFQPVVQHRKAN